MPSFPPTGGGSGVTDVTFPLSGTGSGGSPLETGPWLNAGLQVYASPAGDDSHDGTSWATAKLHGYNAAQLLVPNGGVLNYVDGTSWGGPVSNQGMWFRGDGLDVAGFLPQMPLTVIGWQGSIYSQFSYASAARMMGGASTGQGRLLPAVWLCRTGVPMVIQNFIPNNSIANTPYRVGWDYRRKSDGTINWANITNWNRTSGGPTGQATVTVALPTGINVTSANRTSNITTLNFASTAPLPIPVSGFNEQWIHVTSTDPNFASGDYQVTGTNGVDYIQYSEIAANASGTTIGSWASTGICAHDRIEVLSVSAEVPSTMYKVVSVTDATHFTVKDPYGESPRTAIVSVNNPGQYVLQDRLNYACGVTSQLNCQGAVISGVNTDSFEAGPTFDYGGSQDARQVIAEAACVGGYALNSTSNHFYDEDRAACFLFDGGSFGTPAIVMHDCRPAAGSIRAYPSRFGSSTFDIRRVIPDITISVAAPPVVDILDGTLSYQLWADQCYNTDNVDPTVPNVRWDAAYYGRVHVNDCGLVDGPGGFISGVWGTSGVWTSTTKSPLQTGTFGQWAGGRLSGYVPSTFRSVGGGIFSARFQNLIPDDSSSWLNGIGATVTPGQADPFGGTNAVNIAGSGLFRFLSYVTTGNAVGDYWIVGGLVSRSGGIPPLDQDVFRVNQVNDNGPWQLIGSVPFEGDGEWQPVYNVFRLTNAAVANNNTIAYVFVDTSLTVYHPTLYRIPNSAGLTPNEVYEYVYTMTAMPAYLKPGYSGTDLGRKFVAHGGLGTAARYTVGAGSGQITIGSAAAQAIEVFDELGTSLGVLRPSAFTVNP